MLHHLFLGEGSYGACFYLVRLQRLLLDPIFLKVGFKSLPQKPTLHYYF